MKPDTPKAPVKSVPVYCCTCSNHMDGKCHAQQWGFMRFPETSTNNNGSPSKEAPDVK